MNGWERQQVLDEEHLRLLRIGYFTMGGVSAFTGLFGLFYVFMGVLMASAFSESQRGPGQAPPEFIAWLFAGIGVLFLVLAGGYAALCFLTARFLRLRRGRTLCLVTAGLSCIYVPFGTLLGIFTLSVLGRPTVKSRFDGSFSPAPPPPYPMPPPPPPAGTV